MNVRIFWVHVMKCMCAQTRPRFILSSERVFGGMEFELMLTPREKSPLPENFPKGGSNPWCCGQRAQTLPMSYSGPDSKTDLQLLFLCGSMYTCLSISISEMHLHGARTVCNKQQFVFLTYVKACVTHFLFITTLINLKVVICHVYWRQNVTTSMVGLQNYPIRKYLTENGTLEI